MRLRFPRRRAKASGGQAEWPGPPRLAERSCCCPAKPVVRVLIPPTPERRHPVDLLLCGHHYLACRGALAGANAVAIDETGSVLDPGPTTRERGAPPVPAPRVSSPWLG
jgi:hypothetical protein